MIIERTDMRTEDEKILENHRKRQELNKSLNTIVSTCMESGMDMNDVAAELDLAKNQLFSFIGHSAWERAKKMEAGHGN